MKGVLWSFLVHKHSYDYIQCFSTKHSMCILKKHVDCISSLRQHLQMRFFEYLKCCIVYIHVC